MLSGHLLAGADGTSFVAGNEGVGARSLTGAETWSAPASYFGATVLRAGSIDTADAFASTRVSRAQASGATLETTPWPMWGSRVVAAEDGSSFVELLNVAGIGTSFAGVARVSADGATQWIEKADCDPGGNDFPKPHDFVRRGADLVLVCDTHDSGVHVLELDGTDTKTWETYVDGSLSGDVASSPDDDLVFFVSFVQETASLVTIAHDGVSSSLGPSLPRASIAAIASDGTIIATTKDGVAAISKGTLRWQETLSNVSDVFVDSEHTVVVATDGAVLAFDVTTGSKTWSVALPTSGFTSELASAGPGKIYVLTYKYLTLLSD